MAKAPSRLVQIALTYVAGLVLAMAAATWTVVLTRPRLAGGPESDVFWSTFRELWEGAGSAFLPTVLIGGVLQAIVYRSLKANKAPVFVVAFVVLTSAMAFGLQMLTAQAAV